MLLTENSAQPGNRAHGITLCISRCPDRSSLVGGVNAALAAARVLQNNEIKCEVLIVTVPGNNDSVQLALAAAMADATGLLHAVTATADGNIGAMRTSGVIAARYRWVCFLEGGNELVTENLLQLYNAARTTDAAFVYCNSFVSATNSGSDPQPSCADDIARGDLLDINYFDAMSLTDAEQAIELGGFTTSCSTAGGWEFLLRLIDKGRQIVFVPILLGTLSSQAGGEIDVARLRRIFSQRRSNRPADLCPRVHHPAMGYLT